MVLLESSFRTIRQQRCGGCGGGGLLGGSSVGGVAGSGDGWGWGIWIFSLLCCCEKTARLSLFGEWKGNHDALLVIWKKSNSLKGVFDGCIFHKNNLSSSSEFFTKGAVTCLVDSSKLNIIAFISLIISLLIPTKIPGHFCLWSLGNCRTEPCCHQFN